MTKARNLANFVAITGDLTVADKVVHEGDTNTAIRFPAADTVTVETSGAERMRINSAGNVGIGTSSPATLLHLTGTSTSYTDVTLEQTDTTLVADQPVGRFLFKQNDDSGAGTPAVFGAYAENPNGAVGLRFYTGSNATATERMRIDASGNLGLGVTPSAWGGTAKAFEFSGGSLVGFGTGSQEYWYNSFYNGTNTVYKFSGTGAMQYKQTGTGHSWYTAPSGTAGNPITFTQAMTLDASGRLMVGNTSQQGAITSRGGNIIATNVGAADTLIAVVNDGTTYIGIGLNTSGSTNAFGAPTGTGYFGSSGAYALVFGNGGTERARIDASGNLLVGTTSGTERLSVAASALSVGTLTNTRNVNGDQVLCLANGANANNVSSYYLVCQQPGVANRMFIYGNGNVVNLNNSYGALSDEKLKENIIDSGSQWDDMKAVRVRKYSLKADNADGPNQIGVVAQELEAAGMGGLVFESPELGVNNEPTGETIKQVNYSVLYMKAVKALQEAMARIEALEARLAAANL